ncbi:hypothetical protein GOV12_07520 [Candidatus Pacearchaeota archaeon]|nr:hypothetical protein [Candidatus Pacearchaeota archaeon]
MVDGEKLVRKLREIVNYPDVDASYIMKMIHPIIEDPVIGEYFEECAKELAKNYEDDEEDIERNPRFQHVLRSFALMIGVFYGREQQKEIDRLEEGL